MTQVPDRQVLALHVGKALHCLGETGYGLLRVPVLNAVAHAVTDVPFQHYLAHPVQGGFGSIDLGEDVFTGHVLVDHAVYGLYLAQNLFEAPVEIGRIHALLHEKSFVGCVSGP